MDSLLLLIIPVHALACLSPGPDSLLTLRNTLVRGAAVGYATLGGILTGVSIHIALAVGGLSLVASQHPLILRFIALAGALYFFYLGVRSLRPVEEEEVEAEKAAGRRFHGEPAQKAARCRFHDEPVAQKAAGRRFHGGPAPKAAGRHFHGEPAPKAARCRFHDEPVAQKAAGRRFHGEPVAQKAAGRRFHGGPFAEGLLTNLLNAKAILYFLSIFSITLGAESGTGLRLQAGAIMIVTQLVGYSALIEGARFFRAKALHRSQRTLDRIAGVAFLFFALVAGTFALGGI